MLALARYFHGITLIDIGRPAYLLTPLLLVAAPALLMLRQPDLGTAGMLVVGSAVLFFRRRRAHLEIRAGAGRRPRLDPGHLDAAARLPEAAHPHLFRSGT